MSQTSDVTVRDASLSATEQSVSNDEPLTETSVSSPGDILNEADECCERVAIWIWPWIYPLAQPICACCPPFHVISLARCIVISAAVAAYAYVIDIIAALFIRTWLVFISCEQTFVIACFVFAWIASILRVRTWVWSEYKRQKRMKPATPSSRRQQMICKMCAYAQTDAGFAVVVVALVVRLGVRALAFAFSPLLIIETTCEACGSFFAAVLASAYVMTSGEDPKKASGEDLKEGVDLI